MCWMEDALGRLWQLGRYRIPTASYCRITSSETGRLSSSPLNAVKTMTAMPTRTRNKLLRSVTNLFWQYQNRLSIASSFLLPNPATLEGTCHLSVEYLLVLDSKQSSSPLHPCVLAGSFNVWPVLPVKPLGILWKLQDGSFDHTGPWCLKASLNSSPPLFNLFNFLEHHHGEGRPPSVF